MTSPSLMATLVAKNNWAKLSDYKGKLFHSKTDYINRV